MTKGCLITFAAVVTVVSAQEVRFAGPVTGWVYDPPSQAIRLVTGNPGAALFGQALLTDISWASAAPGSTTPLAVAIRSGELVLLKGETVSTLLDHQSFGSDDLPLHGAWLPDASAIVLVWSRGAQLVRLNSPAETAARSQWLNLPAEGAVSTVAASSRDLFFAVAGSGVYRASLEDLTADPALIAPALDCGALALHPSAASLWVADRAAAALLRVSLESGDSYGVTAVSVAGDPGILEGASALRFSNKGESLWIASAATRKLHGFRFDGESLAPAEVATSELDSTATQLTPMSRSNVFLLGLRASASDPLYIWDELAGTVFFIPGGAPASEERQ